MMKFFFRAIILPALAGVVFSLIGLPSTEPAFAQTANNLKCRGCVDKRDIGKKAVRSKHIKDGSIKTKDLGAGVVDADKIGNGAITSAHILDRQVEPNDLALDAQPTAAAASESLGDPIANVGLGVQTVIRTVTIDAPGPGGVVAHFDLVGRALSGDGMLICAVTTGTTAIGERLVASNIPDDKAATISGTKLFPVSASGSFTLNVICYAAMKAVKVSYPSLTLLFVPQVQTIVSD